MKYRNAHLSWIWFFLIALLFSGQTFARSLPEFTELVEDQGAAVVNISTTQQIKRPMFGPGRGGPGPDQEMPDIPEGPFGDLFRHFFGDVPPGEMEEFDTHSLGSGFIISRDGYVLTNHHVIKDASEIIVRLNDRRELEAKLIGSDERSDIALLKLEADDLPVVKLGNSDDLKVGEWVLAIGSPFGFEHSATAGIVSAKGRSLPQENYVPFIQTDVAINPGNSGGPLFDLDGNVIGINSQIYSRTGGFMGLSFAIPVNIAMSVVEQLKENGHVSRGWLGVLIQDVTRELAESFEMDKPQGALVARVLPDSPAAQGGLQVGDIITRFNGKEVVRSSDLPPMVGVSPVGEKMPVEILRDGSKKRVTITLGELPEEEEMQASQSAPAPSATENRLNVAVAELTPEQRERLEIAENGVLVTQVMDGPARRAGIRRGDVILMLDNKDVTGAKEFKKMIEDLPEGKSVPVLVQRRGAPVFLALKIEK